MLDIKFLRENPEVVKQNIRNKFQDQKLELVDKVIELDKENRDIKQEVEALRAKRNKISKQIGALMGQGKREEAEEVKKQVAVDGSRIEALSAREKEVEEEIKKIMMVIPNIIDPSVPIGKDDSENVEAERFGEPVVPDFEIPYHTDIMESFDGIDMDAAGRVWLPKPDKLWQVVRNTAIRETSRQQSIRDQALQYRLSSRQITNIRSEACFVCHKVEPPRVTLERERREPFAIQFGMRSQQQLGLERQHRAGHDTTANTRKLPHSDSRAPWVSGSTGSCHGLFCSQASSGQPASDQPMPLASTGRTRQ